MTFPVSVFLYGHFVDNIIIKGVLKTELEQERNINSTLLI